MANCKEIVSVILTIFLIEDIILTCEASLVTIEIRNNMGDKSDVSIHCYGNGRDYGSQLLTASAPLYGWNFDSKLFKSPKYYCDFKTKHGSGNYAVYDFKMNFRCHDACKWIAQENGLCLQENVVKHSSWCQNWKNPAFIVA
ncbi:S-protein homolog 19-like [Andrographis paniculata]|uniref:S-protein homolog 19-like n=1 Tax=Andrographis paniculata TaxID=175694 RepID=UPI0021E79A04|nr:S-protein homolog 19-like [Andrographis paniculata]